MTCPTLVRRREAPAQPQGPVRSAVGAAPGWATRRLRPLVDGDATLAQLARFAMAGGLASAVQLVLFLLLSPVGALLANLFAWAASTALANELHRRRTFHAGGRVGWLTAQWEGGGLALLGLGITSGALATLEVLVPAAGPPLQALLVLAVNATVGIARFLALRWAFWVHPGTA